MKLSIGEGEENLDDVFIILPADQQTLIIEDMGFLYFCTLHYVLFRRFDSIQNVE